MIPVSSFLFVQLLAPPLAIIWLAFGRPVTSVDLLLRTLAAVALLLAAALTGTWLLLPRLIVVPLGLLLLAALFVAVRPLARQSQPAQVGAVGWLVRALCLVVTLAAGWVAGQGMSGRTPPDSPVDLALPFPEGRYLVTAGGSNRLLNSHVDAMVSNSQVSAVDLVRIDGWGFRTHAAVPFSQPAEPSAYRMAGTTVVAPCSGKVQAVVDDQADLPVTGIAETGALGNHVVLRCAGLAVVLGGLKQGSIVAAVGTRVARDEPIGTVGTSSGGEPHLHMHVQRAAASGAAPLSGAPLSFRLSGSYPVRNMQYVVR